MARLLLPCLRPLPSCQTRLHPTHHPRSLAAQHPSPSPPPAPPQRPPTLHPIPHPLQPPPPPPPPAPQPRAPVHPALLDVRTLRTYFPIKSALLQTTTAHVKAVDRISFHIDRGETLGLVGESGCGKTTVGRTILRLVPAT